MYALQVPSAKQATLDQSWVGPCEGRTLGPDGTRERPQTRCSAPCLHYLGPSDTVLRTRSTSRLRAHQQSTGWRSSGAAWRRRAASHEGTTRTSRRGWFVTDSCTWSSTRKTCERCRLRVRSAGIDNDWDKLAALHELVAVGVPISAPLASLCATWTTADVDSGQRQGLRWHRVWQAFDAEKVRTRCPRGLQVRLQEEFVIKEKALRDTQIKSIHEMGELKRAQELRVVEFSVQTLRESHDTIQRLTSQVQELRERMNYLTDSGEFHEVESNCSGFFCHVPSRRAVIPSLRSMLSRDKRLPLETLNLSEPQGNFFGNRRPVFDSSQTPHQGILHPSNQSATGAFSIAGKCRETCRERWRTNWEHDFNADVWKKAVNHEFFLPAEIPHNSTAAQQILQTSELQFYKFTTSSSFLHWKIRSKTQVSSCSQFPSDAMLWIREVEMVDSVDESKSSRSTAGKDLPNFELLDAKIASALHKMSDWCSWHSTGLCWSILYHSSQRWCSHYFDTTWDEIPLCPRSHRMMFGKICANWEFASLTNLKLYWNSTLWKFIKRYRCPIFRSWRGWWRGP